MTRRLLLVLALLAFAAPQLIPQTSQQGFGTVQGTVVRQGTTEPIPDVQITLTGRGGTAQDAQALLNAVARGVVSGGMPPEAIQAAQEAVRAGAQALTAVTDSGGKFTIRNVPAGFQNLRAQLEGYFAPALQGNYPSAASMQMTITANQTSDVHLSMLPGGTISGRILDPVGKPLADSQVQILRYAYQNGARTLQPFNFKTSDDRGEYRMYRLAPGEYYVAVNPRRTGSRGNGGTAPQETPVATFYPNAVDVAAALPVKVRSGDDLSGVNIQVRTGITVKVSGRVISSIPVTASVNARGQTRPSAVILIPRDTRGFADLNAGSVSFGPDGAFEFQNVTPGRYEILARLPEEPYKGWGTANPPAFATGPWAFGRAAIEVRDVNVDNVSVVVRTGIDLNGRVIVDGKPTRANVRITLEPDDMDDINDIPSANTFGQIYQFLPPIAEDGSFAIPFLPVGRYRFVVSMNGLAAAPARGAAGQPVQPAAPLPPPLPATAYLADIRQGPTSVYDDGLVVGSERLNPVDVIVNTNAGSLEGSVSGADQKPSAGNTVVLVPAENRRQNTSLYMAARTDAQGHFTMTRLAPGRYTVYAWEAVPYGAYQNAEFMSKYEGRGTSVVIEAGARATANLKAIPDDTSQR